MPFLPNWRRLACAGVLALGFLAACSSSRRQEVAAAPNFELKDLEGKRVSLESFRGRPVLLDFWATWCGPCRLSIPLVQEFYQRHKDKGLVVLGLNMDEDPSGVYGFTQHYKITYPILFAGNSSVPGDYEVEGIPHFVFVDTQGRILRAYQGFGPELIAMWEENLKDALAKPQ